MRALITRLAIVAAGAPGGCGGQAAGTHRAAHRTPLTQPVRWTFAAERAGGLPPGATVFSGTWAIRAEDGAPSPPNALCQTATAEFPALTLGDAVYSDLGLAARVKPIAGQSDQ